MAAGRDVWLPLFVQWLYMSNSNPRSQNGNLRRKNRERFKAMNAGCGICNGRLGPIHYDEPSDSKHPLSFVIDEIKPIARYRESGYESKRAAAEDWNNLQAAHYCCNAWKGAKSMETIRHRSMQKGQKKINVPDGEW